MLIYALLYILAPPMLLFIGKLLKQQLIQQVTRGHKRSNTALKNQQKEPLGRKIRQRLTFTLRDEHRSTKGVHNRLLFVIIFLIGLAVAILSSFVENIWVFLSSYLFYFTAIGFSYQTASEILTQREQVLTRMLDLKKSRMGLVGEGTIAENIKVIEWNKENIFPVQMYLYMPTNFDTLRQEDFLRYFNELFNSNGNWVSNRKDEKHKGFDFNAGIASIIATKPLPQRADWHERYVLSDEIAWSFFPLGLASENGVIMIDPETGEEQHVIGFDLQNNQAKLSASMGREIGSEIVAAPQSLVSGGTGSGKSVSLDTLVEVHKGTSDSV